jgi:hypothetical protein
MYGPKPLQKVDIEQKWEQEERFNRQALRMTIGDRLNFRIVATTEAHNP